MAMKTSGLKIFDLCYHYFNTLTFMVKCYAYVENFKEIYHEKIILFKKWYKR